MIELEGGYSLLFISVNGARRPSYTLALQVAGLGPICRSLEVDFAPALTGFDLQGGRSVPHFEGIVICEVGASFCGLVPQF